MIVAVVVPDFNIWSALIAGLDSGIAYWCKSVEGADRLRDLAGKARSPRSTVPVDLDIMRAKVGNLFVGWCHNGVIAFTESEPHQPARGNEWAFHGWKIREALGKLSVKAPRQFARLALDGGDAETGDALIQCAIFGELVYG